MCSVEDSSTLFKGTFSHKSLLDYPFYSQIRSKLGMPTFFLILKIARRIAPNV
jgi:hypothetical protein